MATERRIIVEKNHWVPVSFDDGSGVVAAVLLLAGLGLIVYALFGMPSRQEVITFTPASHSETGGTTSPQSID